MVSRETTRPLRKLVPAVAIGVSALLGIVGCSAGQVAQTADMEPAVNGNMAQVGKLLLRDVMVAYPENGEAYQVGEDAPLVLTIANTGMDDDELVGVTSPAGKVKITGNATIPSRHSIQVVAPADNPAASETSSESSAPETTGSATSGTNEAPATNEPAGTGAPESETSGAETPSVTETTTAEEPPPDVVGTISIVITGLTGDLPFGKTVPVTFEFRNAGKVEVTLPVGSPTTPRADDRDSDMVEGEAGH